VKPVPMPVRQEKGKAVVDAARILSILTAEKPSFILVEDVHSRPHDGVVSAFSFGLRTGALMGAVDIYAANNVFTQTDRVSPNLWKAAFQCSSDKKQTVGILHTLVPKMKGDFPLTKDGLAEATLIALYSMLSHESYNMPHLKSYTRG